MKIQKTLLVCLSLVCLFACTKREQFSVEGTISGGEKKTLLIEHLGLKKTTVLDSVELPANGNFKFKIDRPEYPDFYRLRINKQAINFAVDSTEQIKIEANFDNFATNYKIEGSTESDKIKALRLSVFNIQRKVNALKKTDEKEQLLAEIGKDIDEHKDLARKIIMENTRSTSAYFALFQQIDSLYLFSPQEKEDYPYYAAVATAYQTFMPEYERCENIKILVLSELKARKIRKEQSEKENEILSKVKENVGYIDIQLPDRNGKEQKLSALEGKVVLIDFSAYEEKNIFEHIFFLRELYDHYHELGLEIYQVSVDRDVLLWEIATENIPWICVRDIKNPYTIYAKLYNVQKIPTSFLMDKSGDILGRDLSPSQLEQKIVELLK